MSGEKPPRRTVRDMFGTTAELTVCPAGEDVLAALVLRAEAECERLGWGGEREAPLRWFWLYDNGRLPDGMDSIAMGSADMSERLAALHPLELVELLGEHMVKVDRNLLGFVLASEGWMVRYRDGDQATEARALAAAGRREIWRQPDREETRIAELQMLNGQTRTVFRIRGGEPTLRGPTPPGDAGEVPAAMARLAVALRLRKYGRRG